MNDRTMIAAMVMQGILANSRMGVLEPWQYAEDAINCADALLKALAESKAERPQFTTSDDQRLVTGGDFDFLSPRPSPEWWGGGAR